MKPPITKLPTSKSFLNLPILLDWSNLKHQAVVFGAPFGKPYSTVEFPNNQSTAPDKLRDASSRILVDPHSVDLDLLSGSTLASISVADGGNVPLKENKVDQHYSDIESAVRYLVERSIFPVSVGGDDGITNPVLRGLDVLNDVTIIQIDAHMIGRMSALAKGMDTQALCEERLKWRIFLEYIKLAYVLMGVRLSKI